MKIQFMETGEDTWISQKFNNGDFDYWIVREVIDWTEHHSEDEIEEFSMKRYTCNLSVVAPSEFKGAREECPEDGQTPWDELSDRDQVVSLYSHAGGVRAWTGDGSNKKVLFAESQKEALLATNLFGFYMDRAQNRIGTTGWDVLKGDFFPESMRTNKNTED